MIHKTEKVFTAVIRNNYDQSQGNPGAQPSYELHNIQVPPSNLLGGHPSDAI